MDAELQAKVRAVAKDFVIWKPLARWNEQYKNFPRFVMEYLVTQYVDPADPIPGQKRIDQLLAEHYSDSSERELIRSRIKENGTYKLIGDLKIRLDARRDTYWADVPAIGENTVRVAPAIRSRYEDMLLTVGAWGQITIEYEPAVEVDGKRHPFGVTDFVPLQLTRISLDDFLDVRKHFTLEEWLDLMVESIGFSAESLTREVKLLMMLRLVPFVESNYNLIELGPRETGKTYTYRNISSRSFVISGSKTTAASLFWAKTGNRIGILGQKEVVLFDEIAHAVFPSDETLSVMKDYMQTGTFSRLGQEFHSDASIVLGGNIDTDLAKGQPSLRYIHLFEPLPEGLQDTAFLDRLHAYLPGWRMPKIVPEAYSSGYGFVSDYLAEVFHRMRRQSLGTVVEELADLDAGSDRNVTAIKKTTAGLLKLLLPNVLNETPDYQDFATVLELAIDGRRRVVEQLATLLPGEFDPSTINVRSRLTPPGSEGPAARELTPELRQLDERIERVELGLRDLILHTVKGDESLLPQHVVQRADERIQGAARKNPAMDMDRFDALAGKLEYFDLRELEDAITSKVSWHLFERRFISKVSLESKFGQLADLRNGIRHSRRVDHVVTMEGEAAILWFEGMLAR